MLLCLARPVRIWNWLFSVSKFITHALGAPLVVYIHGVGNVCLTCVLEALVRFLFQHICTQFSFPLFCVLLAIPWAVWDGIKSLCFKQHVVSWHLKRSLQYKFLSFAQRDKIWNVCTVCNLHNYLLCGGSVWVFVADSSVIFFPLTKLFFFLFFFRCSFLHYLFWG